MPFTPPLLVSAVALLAARGKTVRFIEREATDDDGVECGDRLEIPVTVDVKIEGQEQALNTTFSATLEAYSELMGSLYEDLSPDAVKGNLVPPLDADERVDGYRFSGTWSPYGLSASLDFWVGPTKPIESDMPTQSTSIDWIATWSTRGDCGQSGVYIPDDAEPLGLSRRSILALLPAELPLEWQDRTTTTLHLEATALDGETCLEDPCYYHCTSGIGGLEDTYDRAGLTFPIELHLFTDDERWQATFHTDINVELLHSGGLGGLSIDIYEDYPDIDAARQSTGFELDDWTANQAVDFSLEVISDATGEAPFRGRLDLRTNDNLQQLRATIGANVGETRP